jgi:Icc-related predicted phosphoesterase
MRIICISDTHSLHEKISPLPDGDVLVHAGDCTSSGTLAQLEDFIRWFEAQPHKHKILIAGNHDFCFQRHRQQAQEACVVKGVTYLRGEEASVGGINFYGFPWQPIFRHMAFNVREAERRGRLALVPDHTDVLVTHSPALRIFDWVPDIEKHVGCRAIAQKIERLPRLKAHICGHIHEGYGFFTRESDGVKFANASICTERYKPTNKPIVIDL